MISILETKRENEEKLKVQHGKVFSSDYINELFNALPYVVTILNEQRQIIYSNKILLNQLDIEEFSLMLGKRPGEAISCVHASECKDGCGASESCTLCGAFIAIRDSMKYKRKVSEECRITSRLKHDGEESYDFEATASPFYYEGEQYTIFSLVDISHAKRRRTLERIFFHDILNTAGNLKNLAEIIQDTNDPEKLQSFFSLLKDVSNELVDEIEEQKQLTSAEDGELKLRFENMDSKDVMVKLRDQFKSSGLKPEVDIQIEGNSVDASFRSDRSLLFRILKNMLKNAIEASVTGEAVSIGVKKLNKRILFYVNNAGYMPRDVQLQVFSRSFSTKSSDRGLGTYSMRLLGEKYLKGRVYFETSPAEGTTFYLDLPANE